MLRGWRGAWRKELRSPGKPWEAGSAGQGSSKSHPALALGLQKGGVFLFCEEAAPSAAREGGGRALPGMGILGSPSATFPRLPFVTGVTRKTRGGGGTAPGMMGHTGMLNFR